MADTRSSADIAAGLGAYFETTPPAVEERAEAVPAQAEALPDTEPAEPDVVGEEADLEADDTSDSPEPGFWKLTVDGQEYEIGSEEEARNLAQKGLHYTKKSQALSREHSEWEQQKSQMQHYLQAQLTEYEQALPQLIQLIQNPLGAEPDWVQLAETNPQQYAVQKAHWDQEQMKLRAAQSELARAQQERVRLQAEAATRWAAEQEQLLKEHVPDWKDDTEQHAVSYLLDQGFSQAELGAPLWRDYRVRSLLLRAMNHDSARATATKEVAKASKTVEPGKGKRDVNERPRAYRDARQRVRSTGKVEDAGALLATLFTDR